MRNFSKLSVVSALAVSLGLCSAFLACGDDDAIVRTRSDGGTDATADVTADGPTPGVLACGGTPHSAKISSAPTARRRCP
jgi:hypothetical protein